MPDRHVRTPGGSDYSVVEDVDPHGVVTGNGTGPVSDDVTALVAITAWAKEKSSPGNMAT
jgi:hypothetical protein